MSPQGYVIGKGVSVAQGTNGSGTQTTAGSWVPVKNHAAFSVLLRESVTTNTGSHAWRYQIGYDYGNNTTTAIRIETSLSTTIATVTVNNASRTELYTIAPPLGTEYIRLKATGQAANTTSASYIAGFIFSSA